MCFTADEPRPFLIVTATHGCRESKGFFFHNKSIQIRSIRLLDSCGITIAISGRPQTITARRGRRILRRALGAPALACPGPLHRIVIRHDHHDSEAAPFFFAEIIPHCRGDQRSLYVFREASALDGVAAPRHFIFTARDTVRSARVHPLIRGWRFVPPVRRHLMPE